jgi:CRISPR-associated endonuclease Csn1
MLEDFKANGQDLKIPYDWTMYYLRKKALSQKIEKEELAWILLNFNQKRGYFQSRGEDEETTEKREYVLSLKIIGIEKGEIDKKNSKRTWYSFILENGWVYSATFTLEPQWLNTEKEFLITEELDENGKIRIVKDKRSDISGKEKRRITPLPTFEEIDLMSKKDQDKIYKKIKAKTEITISNTGKTVGTYIYETLLQNPKQKIKGKLVRTIERKFYKEELKQILEKQREFHQELNNDDLYNDCVRELYRNNEAHQLTLSKKDFIHLFMDDIIFYQRPLRSQKSSISNCTLEFREYKKYRLDEKGNRLKDENGKFIFEKDENHKDKKYKEFLKVIPKSNPYYQEFRIWQWIYNVNIYRKDEDVNVTKEFLNTTKDFENLFDFLNNRKEVDQKSLLKHFKLNEKSHRWNYVEDKKYPCNETKTMISTRLEKVENIANNFLTKEIEQKIWHIIYSVNDKIEYEKALKSFAKKHNLDENSFLEAFKKFPPFKSEYGSFSEKAIKKLLPLMRLGKYWNYADIDKCLKDRIQKIITGEYDEDIKDKVREKVVHLTTENDFQGLQLWLAQYIVYGRHSEASIIGKWNSVDDLEEFLKNFKQHSLRNPIVEQVITETLRVVKDIWVKYGNGAKDFLSEIHIELGREMKLPAEDRKKITNQISENENTNLRIKALISELKKNSDGNLFVKDVRPHSPYQQEALKIYEEYALSNEERFDEDTEEFIFEAIPDDIIKIGKTAQPTKSELLRYKLWLEQKYRSPYTGKMIPLSRLFTGDYQIEHIIPQSRYFDDSFSNKVICESSVNKLKDSYIGFGFIKQFGGTIIELGFGKSVKVFETEEYEDFVKKHYANNRSKKNKLLMEEIPERMIERQLNDTRYISKYISGILSNIVRVEDGSDEGINSKNIVPGNGKITSQLKQDWGLNDVWNDLILPRFERMNQLTNSTNFTAWSDNYQKLLPIVPIEFSKGFSKKRIDHRHHALDALIIACATKDHVNLLNNQSAKSDTKRYDLKKKLMKFEKVIYYHTQTGEKIEREVPKLFLKPWNNFTVEVKNSLEKIIVSFKQNLRVINKATNYFEKYVEKDGVKTKERIEQKGTNWAIRKQIHKETVSGKIDLPWVKVPKGKILTATRKSLDISFDLKSINSITDTAIQKILTNYLEFKGSSDLAFSPEGIEDMNKNIEKYNDGKPHQPINKVRVFELGSKFPLGQSGNKKNKYVEAAKGTNLFFAVYKDKNGKRSYETIPLNEVIERQKQGLSEVELKGTNDFYLCPNDLVYVSTEEELKSINTIDFKNLTKEKSEKIYKVVSFSGTQIFFVRQDIATSIVNKRELSALNKMERAMDGSMVKENCIKLKIDRLGNISKA